MYSVTVITLWQYHILYSNVHQYIGNVVILMFIDSVVQVVISLKGIMETQFKWIRNTLRNKQTMGGTRYGQH